MGTVSIWEYGKVLKMDGGDGRGCGGYTGHLP